MKAAFMRRLERLEAAASARREPPGISQPQLLLRMVLAYRGGAWQEEEALAAGWGRALGYELTSELTRDLKAAPGAVAARHNAVLGDLLAEHGLQLGVSTWEEALPTIEGLFDQIPEPLRLRFDFRSATDAFQMTARCRE